MNIVRRKPISAHPLDLSLPPVLDRVLRQRGVQTLDDIDTQTRALLHFNDFANIHSAVNLVVDAITANKNICIVGDFDADGATSTALCLLCLRDFGHRKAHYIVPNRFDYGYGLSEPVVDLALANATDLLITVDNGISSHAGVKKAKQAGISVLITDHHLPAQTLPEADAIINPNLPACPFPSKHLAGVGVAFYLMLAVRARLVELDYFVHHSLAVPNIANYLDIVALGTIADVVALDKNNRILVHQGIQRIRSGKTRPGIKALLEVAGRAITSVSSSDLGFVLGPRLNAAGRLEDISVGIECLLTESTVKAREFASMLDDLNRDRQVIERDMQRHAEQTLAALHFDQSNLPDALCIYQADFHVGVVGIVAGRLKEKYYRPTFVFAKESEVSIKGSGRSIPGLHIRDLLADINARSPGLIDKFGGHAMAAGLSIKQHNFEEFSRLLSATVKSQCESLPDQAILYSDGELAPDEMNIQIAQLLKTQIPWGQAFDAPTFDGYFEVVQQRIVGEKHLKLVVAKAGQVYDAIAFNVDMRTWPNHSAQNIRMVYRLDINEFNRRKNLQLIVIALALAE